MKILIIGAKGMLGQALAKEFAGADLGLWDKEEIDITDFLNSKAKIQNLKPHAIINCAAYTDVDGCEDNPEAAFKVNAEAVKNLASIAGDLGAVLVQYSTAYVFDGRDPKGYDEDSKTSPLSVYGRSKLEGERAAAKAKKYYILRLDRLFGRPGGGKKSFVDKMLELAESKTRLDIIGDEFGCPTYAPDLAKVTRSILDLNQPYGIYHAANSGSCSWYEWAREIFKIAGIDVELKPSRSADLIRKAKRPKFGVLNNSKLPPLRAWQEALKEFLNHRL